MLIKLTPGLPCIGSVLGRINCAKPKAKNRPISILKLKKVINRDSLQFTEKIMTTLLYQKGNETQTIKSEKINV